MKKVIFLVCLLVAIVAKAQYEGSPWEKNHKVFTPVNGGLELVIEGTEMYISDSAIKYIEFAWSNGTFIKYNLYKDMSRFNSDMNSRKMIRIKKLMTEEKFTWVKVANRFYKYEIKL